MYQSLIGAQVVSVADLAAEAVPDSSWIIQSSSVSIDAVDSGWLVSDVSVSVVGSGTIGTFRDLPAGSTRQS